MHFYPFKEGYLFNSTKFLGCSNPNLLVDKIYLVDSTKSFVWIKKIFYWVKENLYSINFPLTTLASICISISSVTPFRPLQTKSWNINVIHHLLCKSTKSPKPSNSEVNERTKEEMESRLILRFNYFFKLNLHPGAVPLLLFLFSHLLSPFRPCTLSHSYLSRALTAYVLHVYKIHISKIQINTHRYCTHTSKGRWRCFISCRDMASEPVVVWVCESGVENVTRECFECEIPALL